MFCYLYTSCLSGLMPGKNNGDKQHHHWLEEYFSWPCEREKNMEAVDDDDDAHERPALKEKTKGSTALSDDSLQEVLVPHIVSYFGNCLEDDSLYSLRQINKHWKEKTESFLLQQTLDSLPIKEPGNYSVLVGHGFISHWSNNESMAFQLLMGKAKSLKHCRKLRGLFIAPPPTCQRVLYEDSGDKLITMIQDHEDNKGRNSTLTMKIHWERKPMICIKAITNNNNVIPKWKNICHNLQMGGSKLVKSITITAQIDSFENLETKMEQKSTQVLLFELPNNNNSDDNNKRQEAEMILYSPKEA